MRNNASSKKLKFGCAGYSIFGNIRRFSNYPLSGLIVSAVQPDTFDLTELYLDRKSNGVITKGNDC